MRFVFLGPPGVGKGTQAEKLSKRKNIPHISSGNLLRESFKAKTSTGIKAQKFIENGLLVPDTLVVEIVVGKIDSAECSHGFILDGFPRNLSQARILSDTLDGLGKTIDWVFSFTASDETIVNRIAGRRICGNCDAQYHETFKLPLNSDVCDKCGSELYRRDDDNPETVLVRLQVFKEQVRDLMDFYRKKKGFVEVDCEGDNLGIRREILEVLSGS